MPSPISCRCCGSDRLEIILRLGQMPLANAYLSREELALPERKYPLDLAFCPCCSLVQITETIAARRAVSRLPLFFFLLRHSSPEC